MWPCCCLSFMSPCEAKRSRVDVGESRLESIFMWHSDCVISCPWNGDLFSLPEVRESYRSTNPSELFFPLMRRADARMNLETELSLLVIPLPLNLDEKESWIRERKTWNSRGRTGKQLIMIPMVISACVQKPKMIKLCVISSELTNLKV